MRGLRWKLLFIYILVLIINSSYFLFIYATSPPTVSNRGLQLHSDEGNENIHPKEDWGKILPTNPVILIPGICGSILEEQETKDQLWLQLLGANKGVRKMWGVFDPNSGEVHSQVNITVSDIEDGLFAINNLNPSTLPFLKKSFDYFRPLTSAMLTDWGYVSGDTLFGFPYVWNQSIRYRPTLLRLYSLIQRAFLRHNEQVNIITHSMGAMVLKAMLASFPTAKKYIHTWIALTAPFDGGSANLWSYLKEGTDFEIPTLNRDIAKRFVVQSPPLYELLPWGNIQPLFQNSTLERSVPHISMLTATVNGIKLEFHHRSAVADVFAEITKDSFFGEGGERISTSFDINIYRYAEQTRKLLESLPRKGVVSNFFSIVGYGYPTAIGITFPQNVTHIQQLSSVAMEFLDCDGDGSVPVLSALSDRISDTIDRVKVKETHSSILSSSMTFEHLQSMLDIGCPWEGVFETNDLGNFRVYKRGFSAVSIVVETNSTFRSITAKRVGANLLGYLELVIGLSAVFSVSQSPDCSSFSGIITGVHAITENGKGKTIPQKFEGKRNIGKECELGSQKRCVMQGGKGMSNCIFGRYEQFCRIRACSPLRFFTGYPDGVHRCALLEEISPPTTDAVSNEDLEPSWSKFEIGSVVLGLVAFIAFFIFCCCTRKFFAYSRIPTDDGGLHRENSKICEKKSIPSSNCLYRLHSFLLKLRAFTSKKEFFKGTPLQETQLDIISETDVDCDNIIVKNPRRTIKKVKEAVPVNTNFEVVDQDFERGLDWTIIVPRTNMTHHD